MLVAHRGGAALAPENTLEAFVEAVELWGADMLELDVRLTADGEVVVIHDDTVDRTTNGTGPVAELTWAEIRHLDAGARFVDTDGRRSRAGHGIAVPRFRDVLERLPNVRLNVETKCREVAAPLRRDIEAHGAARRVLIAAERESDRTPARGYRGPWGASKRQLVLWVLLGRTPRADILQIPTEAYGINLVEPRRIAAAHRANLPVHVWTVDDPAEMHRLLDLGVDGIQTDRPDLLEQVLHERIGRPLPPGLLT